MLYNSSVKNNKIHHVNLFEVPPKDSIIAKGDSAASKKILERSRYRISYEYPTIH